MLDKLTRRQTLLLNFIRDFTGEKGYPPSVREMMDYMRVSSPNGLVCHLKALTKKGYIERDRKQARGIRLTKQAGIPLLTLNEITASGGW